MSGQAAEPCAVCVQVIDALDTIGKTLEARQGRLLGKTLRKPSGAHADEDARARAGRVCKRGHRRMRQAEGCCPLYEARLRRGEAGSSACLSRAARRFRPNVSISWRSCRERA